MQNRDQNFERIEGVKSNILKDMHEREQELIAYRERIAVQERELDEFRTKLKNEQFVREKEIQKELEAREKFFADRERKIFERQREVEEQLRRRQIESEQLRVHLEQEIVQREKQLKEAMKAIELEKIRYNEESRRTMENKSKDYVSDTLTTLEVKEKQFHFFSKIWSFVGALSLVCGLIFFGYVSINTFASMPLTITWEYITFSVFKGLVAVALFGALAKYGFLFSNSYMREALKNGDRRHAINFGKFYLESYGAAAEWSQIKEAFEHWNITGSNTFNGSDDAKLEVTVIEKVAGALETIGKYIPAVSKEKKDK